MRQTDIEFREDEKLMKNLLEVYEELLEEHYPNILQWSHHKLWEQSGRLFTPSEWKKFITHPKVDAFYQSELVAAAKQKAFRILSGDNLKSTGEAQQLQQTLSLLEKNKESAEKQDTIIYAFVPLNNQEEEAPNVRILDNIPAEIKNAVQSPKRNK